MGDQDLEDSLRIARREHALAVERQDDESAAILERAIVDLEHEADERHVLRLPDLHDLPRQREPQEPASESDEVR